MAERLALIMQLGALATDAAQRGDDRAAQTCQDAAELLFADKSAVDWLDQHRRRDRERKPKREGNPRISVESAEIQSASQGFSPTPPFPNSPETRVTPREADDAIYVAAVERLTALLAMRLGERWSDVDGFLRRREYSTWKAWMNEMLSVITGGRATEEDLAQVCRDDEALERPIGSPKGLRTFVASAVGERTNPPAQRNPQRRGGVAARTFDNGRKALEGL